MVEAAAGAGGSDTTAAEAAPSELDTAADATTDRDIERVLERRFRQIEELEQVEVSSSAGVVRLEGTVLSAEAAAEAEEMAQRTDGVAVVENDLELERSVQRRVGVALDSAKDRLWELVTFLPLLVLAIAILGLAIAAGRWLAGRDALFERLSDSTFVRNLLKQLVRAVAAIVGALIALDLLGATALVGALLGTAGIVGLAIGFAFQDLVENYIASVLLSLRQPFEPSDLVDIDGRMGKVVRLTSRATVLMTLDGNHLRIPNAQVFKAVILNYSRNPLRRFDFGVGVGVDVDLIEAQELGLDVLRSMEGVLDDPEAWSQVQELGDSNVLVRFYGWVDQRRHDFTKVQSSAIRRVKVALEDAGIDMPEPIYRVNLLGAGAAALGGSGASPPALSPPEAPARRPPIEEDLSIDDAIDRQIDAERARDGEDLLDDAPHSEI